MSALNRKAGSYYNELEANSSKLNTSVAEIDKLNEEIKSLQKLNNSIVEPDTDSLGVSESIALVLYIIFTTMCIDPKRF